MVYQLSYKLDPVRKQLVLQQIMLILKGGKGGRGESPP